MKMKRKKTDGILNRKIRSILVWICVFALLSFPSGGIAGYAEEDSGAYESDIVAVADIAATESAVTISLADIPDYSGTPCVVINDNVPFFDEDDLTTTSYEFYSELDSLGRCGVALANIGQDIMPTEERGEIGPIKPSGWHTVKYEGIDGNYLYNRCHLIGYQLSGENANEKNLITGTRYLNVEGMLPYEDMVAEYVQETANHVLYRVTPIFDGDNLVASGVLMEAVSVEDNGEGVRFNIYCYNVQPGIVIDYATGDSYAESEVGAEAGESEALESEASENVTDLSNDEDSDAEVNLSDDSEVTYILNTNTKKFHYPSCPSVSQMSEKNKQEYTGSREDVISMGYEPCKNCNP
ncbi:MAG: DNA/RNA non-specific endonuclease [Lachnospiraceae bacterium]|nr:DNA/RNA non-specific endonuclease [Lachnospiraceae bacterium]